MTIPTIAITLESLNRLGQSFNFILHGDVPQPDGSTEYNLEFKSPYALFSFLETIKEMSNVSMWRLRDPIFNTFDPCVLILTVPSC